MCLDRAGLVGEDGPTHHGVFDIASLRPVPGLTIFAPMDGKDLRRMMITAAQDGMGTCVIRYPRGRCQDTDWHIPLESIPVGKARRLKEGKDVAVLSLGPVGFTVQEAICQVEEETPGHTIEHYDMRFAKPLDTEVLDNVSKRFRRIVTIEDGVKAGGFGSAVLEYLSAHGYEGKVTIMGLPDCFVEHGELSRLFKEVNLDIQSIKNMLQ